MSCVWLQERRIMITQPVMPVIGTPAGHGKGGTGNGRVILLLPVVCSPMTRTSEPWNYPAPKKLPKLIMLRMNLNGWFGSSHSWIYLSCVAMVSALSHRSRGVCGGNMGSSTWDCSWSNRKKVLWGIPELEIALYTPVTSSNYSYNML